MIAVIYEYRTAANQRVHLTRQNDDAVTLCGRVTSGMFLGDETLMGKEATCGSCSRVHASDAEGQREGQR